jgi:hypothetical protein
MDGEMQTLAHKEVKYLAEVGQGRRSEGADAADFDPVTPGTLNALHSPLVIATATLGVRNVLRAV